MCWGFSHLGRFASEYRKLFNETPSATLQRSEARRNRSL
jgi:AraC-like DNA-binding protein